MNFWIILLSAIAGVSVGLGISQVICNSLIADNNRVWIRLLKSLELIEIVRQTGESRVYRNVTVVTTPTENDDDEVSWFRQDDTVEMTVEEWEKYKSEHSGC